MKIGDTVHWCESSNNGTENLCVFQYTGTIMKFGAHSIRCLPREGVERNVPNEMVQTEAKMAQKVMHVFLEREKRWIDKKYNEVLASLR